MRLNRKPSPTAFGQTHEGAPAKRMTDEQALRRSVMSCLLWEDEFYEDGKAIAERIGELAKSVDLVTLAKLAVEARHEAHLRHVPLLLLVCLLDKWHVHGIWKANNDVVDSAIASVISRADELGELVSLYWAMNPAKDAGNKKAPLAAKLKKGLARAFLKFDEYQLGKYNRDADVKLRDVLFLCHPKPDTPERQALWDRLAKGELATPDTWEVGLSAGGDKKETFERLLREGKLGYLALLRNLRNMQEAKCDVALVNDAILARKNGAHRVLPFRFVAAARAAPQFEPALDTALCETIASLPMLKGSTFVAVDVSGSMDAKLSAKSDMTRIDAAAALASVINAEHLRVFSFSEQLCEGPPRRGMAGVDALKGSQQHGGTYLGATIAGLNTLMRPTDRLIVISDEQTADKVPDPVAKRAYMINVASAKHGVGYGPWTHIDGFSENVLRFMHELERDA